MDQAPESRFEADESSLGDSSRTAEPTISCVLPWQGSAEGLRHHVLPLLDDVSALVRRWELILVDDGCEHGAALATWAQVEGIRVVRLTRRFGHDAAIAAGLQRAHGDVVVVLQGDDASASQLIAGMLVRWRQGFDVVHSAESIPRMTPSMARRLARRLRTSIGHDAPGADPALMRTAHRALLIDRSALADFASPRARAPGSRSGGPGRRPRIAAVPIPPPLAATPLSRGRGGGFGAAATRLLGVLREASRSLGNSRSPSTVDPVFEISRELGLGLTPRAAPLAAQSAAHHSPAWPHA